MLIYGRPASAAPVRAPARTRDGRSAPHPGRPLLADRASSSLAAAVLWALYRWTRFGLATRAASENEASAMLAGLSPNRLALANTVLATAVAGGDRASSRRRDPDRHGRRCRCRSCRRWAPPCSRASRRSGSPASSGLAIGDRRSRSSTTSSTQSWFPTDRGVALPGVNALLTFLAHRRRAVPGAARACRRRGELIETAPARGPAPDAPAPDRRSLGVVVVVVALFVVPFDYRNALIDLDGRAWSSASRSSSSPASSARCRSCRSRWPAWRASPCRTSPTTRASASRSAPICGVARRRPSLGFVVGRRRRCACAASASRS